MLGPRPRPMAKKTTSMDSGNAMIADLRTGRLAAATSMFAASMTSVVERGKHAAVTFIDLLRISKPQTVREPGIVWIGSGLIRCFERSWDAVCRRRRVARTCFFIRALFLYGCVDGFVVWGSVLASSAEGEFRWLRIRSTPFREAPGRQECVACFARGHRFQ